jgi:hypothetical protein
MCHTWAFDSAQFLLKKVFGENPKLMLQYLGQYESGSAEMFTTHSLNDKEQNVRIEFSLGAPLFFFVNCTKKLQFTHIYNIVDSIRVYHR